MRLPNDVWSDCCRAGVVRGAPGVAGGERGQQQPRGAAGHPPEAAELAEQPGAGPGDQAARLRLVAGAPLQRRAPHHGPLEAPVDRPARPGASSGPRRALSSEPDVVEAVKSRPDGYRPRARPRVHLRVLWCYSAVTSARFVRRTYECLSR